MYTPFLILLNNGQYKVCKYELVESLMSEIMEMHFNSKFNFKALSKCNLVLKCSYYSTSFGSTTGTSELYLPTKFISLDAHFVYAYK